MKMFHMLAAGLALTATSPAFAQGEVTSFTRDGVTYTYTVEQIGSRRVIEGRATPGEPFRLVVSGSKVTGQANGVPVSFRYTPKATEQAAATGFAGTVAH